MVRFLLLFVFSATLLTSAYGQRPYHLADNKDIWVCPSTFVVDTSLMLIGYVKTGVPKKKEKADFSTQMQQMATEAHAMGGQIMVVSNFRDAGQSGNYAMRFNVYKAKDIEKFAVNGNTPSVKDANQATIVLYRPIYSGSYNDSVSFDIMVNDTLRLPLNGNMKYVLRSAPGNNIKLTVASQGIVEQISLSAGKTYYFRGFVNIPRSNRTITNGGVSRTIRGYSPYIESISEMQGELESSFLNNYIIWKRI